MNDDDTLDFGRAIVLLEDAFLVLERDKVSPPLQKRIKSFLCTLGSERHVNLCRAAIQADRHGSA